MSGCNLDSCQLKDDVSEIKTKQQEMHDSTIRMVTSQEAFVKRIDVYIGKGEKEHAEFFKRTRWGVTWPALGTTLAALLGGTYTALKLLEVI